MANLIIKSGGSHILLFQTYHSSMEYVCEEIIYEYAGFAL